jgi:hypothetical protein
MSAAADRGRRAVRDAAWRLRSLAIVDRAGDHHQTVMLVGSARSGTTWLAELIDRHHDHRLIFEPLRPDTVPQMSVFSDGQYLRPGADAPPQRRAMSDLLNGRIRNPWSDHLNRVVVPRRRLVKEIRGNLLVPWILEQFPGTPVVLIVRHPLAVAMSRRSLGWKEHLGTSLVQPDLVADHLTGVADELGSLTDPLQRQVAQWSIENLVPLRMTTPEQLCVVSYEELILEPAAAAERVLGHLGQASDGELAAALSRPSRLSRSDSAVSTGSDLLASFRRHLEPGDAERAQAVLELMGLDQVYPAGRDDADVDALAALHSRPFEPPEG